MYTRRTAWLLALLLAACSGSSNGSDPGTGQDIPDIPVTPDIPVIPDIPQHETLGPDFTVVTFNTGLARGFVDHAEGRLPLIGPALAALEADVVCLQEVWTDGDAAAIVQAAASAFPHNYREATTGENGNGETGCTAEEIEPLEECARENCSDVTPENLGTCVLGNCGAEFGAVSDSCQGCFASQLGNPLDDMIEACLEGAGGSWAYDGRNGLLILSRHPMTTREMTRFDSYLNVRVALHALVQDPQMGTVDVFCTHLTANLGGVTYGGNFASWEAEQAAQIDALLEWVEEKRTAVVVVVAGDMNCGPDHGTGVVAEFGDNFAKFSTGGFSSPYLSDSDSPCTWCADNPLVGGGPNNIIDHVLVRGSWPFSTALRILDNVITLDGDPEIETRLSDHYGVSTTVVVPLI
jgi:endonuclease/exonuclease/phosphatase family metal-dependent hydrolase